MFERLILSAIDNSNCKDLIGSLIKTSDFFSISYHKKDARLLKNEDGYIWIAKHDLENSYCNFLNQLEEFRVHESPFQVPPKYEKGIRTLVYPITYTTKQILLHEAEILYVSEPCYPRDIAFYKNNKLWFYSITHENFCVAQGYSQFWLNDINRLNLDVRIEN